MDFAGSLEKGNFSLQTTWNKYGTQKSRKLYFIFADGQVFSTLGEKRVQKCMYGHKIIDLPTHEMVPSIGSKKYLA